MKTTIKNHIAIVCYVLLTGLLLQSCQNQPDYKAVRQQVIDKHDKIMADGERATNNKMKLDTLALSGLKQLKKANSTLDTLAEKQTITSLINKLDDADDKMNDWMHAFKTDVEGKTNKEAVAYFNAEKLKVEQLDSVYKVVLKQTDDYLKKLNIKPDTAMSSHDHMKM
jgi:hypothetical protein